MRFNINKWLGIGAYSILVGFGFVILIVVGEEPIRRFFDGMSLGQALALVIGLIAIAIGIRKAVEAAEG